MSREGPVLLATPIPLIPFPTGRSTPSPLRVTSKERRGHSAHTPRSQTPGLSHNPASTSSTSDATATKREPVDLPKRKRAQSAVEARQVVSLSLAETPYGSKVWGETSYSADYKKKKPVPLPTVRPSSATRMHNPHPSKMFLQWRIPTRIHKHDRAVAPTEEMLKDIHEDFYKDYSSNIRPGDDKCEVPITNVAKIPFPGNKKSFGLELSGKSMKLTTRGSRSSTSSLARDSNQHLEKLLKPPSYAAVKHWIKQANPREKEVFDKMLSATRTEDYETKKALSQVFNPSSTPFIQEWLTTIDTEDRTVAVNVLQDLARISTSYEKPSGSQRSHAKICKSRTWPKQKRSAPSIRSSPLELGVQGMAVMRPYSADKCSQCSSSGKGSSYRHVLKCECKVWKPEAPEVVLWNHRIKPPQKSKPLMGGGSVFSKPHQPRGQHFALHPEWPTA